MKMMRKLFCTMLVFGSCCLLATAQRKKMETDRPSETQTPGLTEKGFLQAETGFRKEVQDKTDFTLLHPETTLKFGLSDKLELRAEIQAETEKLKSKGEYKYGLNPIEVGFKAKLADEKDGLPQTTLLAQTGIPTLAAEDHKVPHLSPQVRLLFQNKLTDKIQLGYNVGAEWDGEDTNPQWVYTFSPQVEIADHWQLFVESFGFLQKGHQPQHLVDGGLAYYISNNVKWDLFGGFGLNKAAPDYFISSGISFRLKP